MVINEVMINPSAVSDANGEYVELYNSGTTSVDLAGWTIRDDGDRLVHDSRRASRVLVPAGGVFLLAAQASPSLNGGFTPDLDVEQFLPDATRGDEVVLVDASKRGTGSAGLHRHPVHGQRGGIGRARQPAASHIGSSVVERRLERLSALGDRGTPGAVNTLQARRYVLSGTLVTMDASLPEASQVFPGKLYVQGNRILDVLHAADPLPADAVGSCLLDTGALIFPGLMNIHDHIAFNTDSGVERPGSDAGRFGLDVARRLQAEHPLPERDPDQLALLRPPAGGRQVCRGQGPRGGNDVRAGKLPDLAGVHEPSRPQRRRHELRRRPRAPAIPIGPGFDVPDHGRARRSSTDMDAGAVDAWLVHLGEGTAEDAPLEFGVLKNVCLLRSETVIIHGTALTPTELDELAAAGGKLIIAPTSNYLYYGATADVVGAVQRGIPVSLSTDWSPAGDKNLLASLKSLALINDTVWSDALTDRQMVEMVTTSPAKVAQLVQSARKPAPRPVRRSGRDRRRRRRAVSQPDRRHRGGRAADRRRRRSAIRATRHGWRS